MNKASWILIAITVSVVIFDVFFATDLKKGNTFSEVILRFSMDHPVIPFAFGVLSGHLMWPQFITGIK